MKRKSAYYALAVVAAVVLAAGMVIGTAGVVLADSEGAGNGAMDSSVSAQPEQGVDQAAAEEIRGPVETGALPDGSVTQEHGGWLNMDVSEQNSSPELRGRPNIQAGE